MKKAFFLLGLPLLILWPPQAVRSEPAAHGFNAYAIDSALATVLAPDTVEQHAVLAWHTISMQQTPVADYLLIWAKTFAKNQTPGWALVQLVRVSGSTDPQIRQWQLRKVKGIEQLQRFTTPPDKEALYGFLKHWGWRSDSCSYRVQGAVDEVTWQKLFRTAPHIDYLTDTSHCDTSP